MYNLNLYPEYELKRKQRRRGTMLTAALTVVACLQVVLVVSQLLNAGTAGRQADRLSDELPRLTEMIKNESQPTPEIRVARELIELRRGRTDWTPALAGLARAVDRSLVIDEIVGTAGNEPGLTELRISGEARDAEGQLQTIRVFMDRLEADDGFRAVLAEVDLGKVKGGANGEFEIDCRSGEVVR